MKKSMIINSSRLICPVSIHSHVFFENLKLENFCGLCKQTFHAHSDKLVKQKPLILTFLFHLSRYVVIIHKPLYLFNFPNFFYKFFSKLFPFLFDVHDLDFPSADPTKPNSISYAISMFDQSKGLISFLAYMISFLSLQNSLKVC